MQNFTAFTIILQGSLNGEVIDDAPQAVQSDELSGQFAQGAPVHCVDQEGALVAAGLSNYSAAEILRIQGKKSTEIAAILGHKDHDEVIHRDNLVLFAGSGSVDE